MLKAMVLGGAINVLLKVTEAFCPASAAILPLGGDDLIQSSGIFMGMLAIFVIWGLIMSGRGADDPDSRTADRRVAKRTVEPEDDIML